MIRISVNNCMIVFLTINAALVSIEFFRTILNKKVKYIFIYLAFIDSLLLNIFSAHVVVKSLRQNVTIL